MHRDVPGGARPGLRVLRRVPRRISYDNCKIAVAKITGGRERELTREFLRLESHYLFEHHFCLVRRPNEKGHVETLVGYARRNFLVPVPETDGLEALNHRAAAAVPGGPGPDAAGQAGDQGGAAGRGAARMLPLPQQAFEARRIEPAKANSLSLVRFDSNDYSVPTEYAHHHVTVIGGGRRGPAGRRATGWWPGIRGTGARSTRCSTRCITWPCWSASRARWTSPGPWRTGSCRTASRVLRRRLEAELGGHGTREFIKVLRLLERATLARADGGGRVRRWRAGPTAPTRCG